MISDRTVWSDEVEMLAKITAALWTIITRKDKDWKRELPDRYQVAVTTANIPTQSELNALTKGLAAQLKAACSGE